MTTEVRAANGAQFEAAVSNGDLETAAELAGCDLETIADLLALAKGNPRTTRAYVQNEIARQGEQSPI